MNVDRSFGLVFSCLFHRAIHTHKKRIPLSWDRWKEIKERTGSSACVYDWGQQICLVFVLTMKNKSRRQLLLLGLSLNGQAPSIRLTGEWMWVCQFPRETSFWYKENQEILQTPVHTIGRGYLSIHRVLLRRPPPITRHRTFISSALSFLSSPFRDRPAPSHAIYLHFICMETCTTCLYRVSNKSCSNKAHRFPSCIPPYPACLYTWTRLMN